MKKKGFPVLALVCSIAFFFMAPLDAHAVLGGSVDSVNKDVSNMKAARQAVTTTPGYTVYDINSSTLELREYVSPDGVVFGIAWNGIFNPDLSNLLGSYYSQYRQARRQTPVVRGKRSMRIQTEDIVVEKWGHMRSMHGRAYVPALLPEGVGADVIR